MPHIPDTMQEEWYKNKARIVEADPDIQNSIKEIEDLTKDLQLDVEDDDDAFRMLQGELHLDKTTVSQTAGNYRNHNKIFGDKLFSTTGFEQRRYPRTTSQERTPQNIQQRRASVPRINAFRASYRKPTLQSRKMLGSIFPSSGPHLFRVSGSGGQLKSPKAVLEELRSHRATILHNNLLRPAGEYSAERIEHDDRRHDLHDDLDIDKFIRANSQHEIQGSAGSSSSRLSVVSTPEGRLESPNPIAFMTHVNSPSSSASAKNTATKNWNKSGHRNFVPAYDDADELMLKDIEQEYL
ncbi:hypothetical protein BIW11_06572 [Tropilaelaps mercedesae]|uniref:Uncharacterized protein n=1 Tax=Tropilaelaps mercedesae TaxID=418985 RepID=A0A1V9XXN6_9ACAR|nr:hypothetical protein BIW11_06572 [Tropilaelaps mercedesae]